MNLYKLHTNPKVLYGYKDRLKVPSEAWDYARKNNKYEEMKPYFMKDAKYVYHYYQGMSKEERWPEAEKYIVKDPEVAIWYAKNILHLIFPSTLFKDGNKKLWR